MRLSLLLSSALSVAVAATDFGSAFAFPASPHDANLTSSTSNIENARFVGRGARGGFAVGGRGGIHGPGGGYAGRGVGVRSGHRVGGRYYGGVWYGSGRRFYGGRWWPYGVGSCWRESPIGFVWICG
jgi:hypothetical protein